jgi:hypothetical protein
MSNQVILWGLFIVPWLTLFLMKKEDIKRFLPVSILATLVALVVNEIGLSYNWWGLKENTFPLQHFYPHYIGLFPVTTMWIFRLAYKKFWLYFATEIFANAGFSFLFVGYLLPSRDISYVNGMAGASIIFFLSTSVGLVLYAYQGWQEGTFVHDKSGKR